MAEHSLTNMRWLRLAVAYAAIVYVAGFILGFLRVVFLVPIIGMRYAELCELPLMLCVCYLAAQKIALWCDSPSQAVRVGWVACGMLLAAEVGMAAAIFGKSIWEALVQKDPISGTAYYLALLVFGALPGYLKSRSR